MVSIDPEIGLRDLLAAGNAEAAAKLLSPFDDEVRKLQPSGATPTARVRGQYIKLRANAVRALAAAGYPVEPGWYYQDERGDWVAVSVRVMKLRTQSGNAGSFYAWPHFGDIEDLSRADIARNMIVEIDLLICAIDARADHIVMANLALRLMATYATYRAEVSNMASHADKKLHALVSNSDGGKQKAAKRASMLRARDLEWAEWAKELQVKNGVELEFELTGLTLELFDLYMEHARPLLCKPDNPFLFPGRAVKPKDSSWFSTQIAQLLEREIGVRVTGQQFRHLIGFLYLLDHPGDYETVRQFLGHTDIRTTIDFYAGMEMRDAAKVLDAAMAKRRAELAGRAHRSIRNRRQ